MWENSKGITYNLVITKSFWKMLKESSLLDIVYTLLSEIQ